MRRFSEHALARLAAVEVRVELLNPRRSDLTEREREQLLVAPTRGGRRGFRREGRGGLVRLSHGSHPSQRTVGANSDCTWLSVRRSSRPLATTPAKLRNSLSVSLRSRRPSPART